MRDIKQVPETGLMQSPSAFVLLTIASFYTVNSSENLDRANAQCKTKCVWKMITYSNALSSWKCGLVLSTKKREFEVFKQGFEQHRYHSHGEKSSISW